MRSVNLRTTNTIGTRGILRTGEEHRLGSSASGPASNFGFEDDFRDDEGHLLFPVGEPQDGYDRLLLWDAQSGQLQTIYEGGGRIFGEHFMAEGGYVYFEVSQDAHEPGELHVWRMADRQDLTLGTEAEWVQEAPGRRLLLAIRAGRGWLGRELQLVDVERGRVICEVAQ